MTLSNFVHTDCSNGKLAVHSAASNEEGIPRTLGYSKAMIKETLLFSCYYLRRKLTSMMVRYPIHC